jgi:hypothetical protein
MPTVARRFLVLQAFMLWQGGFLFYATFVVPAGTHVLGTAARQGQITARVTESLNWCGVVALAALAWDIGVTRDRRRRRGWRWGLWLFCAAGLAALFALHPLLDQLMAVGGDGGLNRRLFRPGHRTYLWVSTFHWLAGLMLAWLTLRAWADEDRRGGT